jgi:hypothetical protein
MMSEHMRNRTAIAVVVGCMATATTILAVANEVGGASAPAAIPALFFPLGISQVCLAAVWLALGTYRFLLIQSLAALLP